MLFSDLYLSIKVNSFSISVDNLVASFSLLALLLNSDRIKDGMLIESLLDSSNLVFFLDFPLSLLPWRFFWNSINLSLYSFDKLMNYPILQCLNFTPVLPFDTLYDADALSLAVTSDTWSRLYLLEGPDALLRFATGSYISKWAEAFSKLSIMSLSSKHKLSIAAKNGASVVTIESNKYLTVDLSSGSWNVTCS